jgi:hypothetical protein
MVVDPIGVLVAAAVVAGAEVVLGRPARAARRRRRRARPAHRRQ